MDSSTATDVALPATARLDDAPRSRASTTGSPLSEPLPSRDPSPVVRPRRTVRFAEPAIEQDIEQPSSSTSRNPRRSTRGKAPDRLVDVDATTINKAPLKRKATKQPPQPPSTRPKRKTTVLQDAPNTLGKKPRVNTLKGGSTTASPRAKPPAPKSTPKPTTTPPQPTIANKPTKVGTSLRKDNRKSPSKRVQQNTVVQEVSKSPNAPPPPIAFKLQYSTFWCNDKVSEDNTFITDTTKDWNQARKQLDESLSPFLTRSRITTYFPYKIQAIITSTGARGLRTSEVIPLVRLEGHQEWQRVLDLIKFNATNNMKDISITIKSIWSSNGLEPAPEAPPAYEIPASSQPTARSRASIRSAEQTESYYLQRALFWTAITQHWQCPDPNHCEIKARRGLSCFVYKGCHYELFFEIVNIWREAVADGEGTLERPSKRIRNLIIGRHFDSVAKRATKAAKARPATTVSPATPSTVINNYLGQQPPSVLPAASPPIAVTRQVSPIPAALNSSAQWQGFWDCVKGAYPEWSVGIDQAKVALDAEYYNLRFLFECSEDSLRDIVKQHGLRRVLKEQLTEYIDNYKLLYRGRAVARALTNTNNTIDSPEMPVEISDDDDSSDGQIWYVTSLK
jgi:hypothetical protein